MSQNRNATPKASLSLLMLGGSRPEEYSEGLVVVGILQAKPIFDRVLALVPDELRKAGE